MERVKLSELKGDLVRAVIEFTNEDGSKRQIEVYNVVGDRREYIANRAQELLNNGEEGIYAYESLIVEMIMEFTDLEVDETSILDIMQSPRIEFLYVLDQITDMIYEITYEQLMSTKSTKRLAGINAMVEANDIEVGMMIDSAKRTQDKIVGGK